jgi:hypothetical protein
VPRGANHQLRSIAYHEAGHAVAHFALARRIDRVTIVPDKECLGRVDGRTLPKSWSHQQEDFRPARELRAAEDFLVSALAGPTAEARFRGRPNLVTGSRDHEQVAELRWTLMGTGAVADAYLRYVEVLAEELIDLHWYLVESLARTLLARPTLVGVAVHATLRTAVEHEARAVGIWPDTELSASGWRQLALVVGREKRDKGKERLDGTT